MQQTLAMQRALQATSKPHPYPQIPQSDILIQRWNRVTGKVGEDWVGFWKWVAVNRQSSVDPLKSSNKYSILLIDELTESEQTEIQASIEVDKASAESLHIRTLVADSYETIPCNIKSTPLSGKTYNMRELALMRIEQEKTVWPPVKKILQNPEWNWSHDVHRTSVPKSSWMNSIGPWSVEWIKKMANMADNDRALKHLLSFIHDTWVKEVTPTLIRWIKELLTAEALLSIWELQQKPQFIKQKWSDNSLEVKAVVAGPDRSKLPVVALVDSGCSGSAIDETFVKENKLLTHNIPIPIPVYNTDRTMNKGGSISKFTMVELIIDDHSEQLPLTVTSLSTHAIFLGFDWLKTHNPEIDWKNQKLTLSCQEDHLPDLIPVEDEEEDVGYKKEEEQLFWIDVESYIRETKSIDLATEANKEKQKQTFETVVPEHYHEFKDVFDKESFDELLPNWPWDHAVELLPGDHMINCKMYNLTLDEQKELNAFLDENLKSGCICPSKSPFASAFFFMKKKDRQLHPIQDYQKLNNITVKNWYPLPLISELIDKLKTAKYFTKLNIHWGYNNIWMKDGDEWKAAFWTNWGLFKPLIMFFSLTNSPATFQTMMNHLFHDLINQGKVVIYMDDIMIFTATLEEHQQIV